MEDQDYFGLMFDYLIKETKLYENKVIVYAIYRVKDTDYFVVLDTGSTDNTSKELEALHIDNLYLIKFNFLEGEFIFNNSHNKALE